MGNYLCGNLLLWNLIYRIYMKHLNKFNESVNFFTKVLKKKENFLNIMENSNSTEEAHERLKNQKNFSVTSKNKKGA